MQGILISWGDKGHTFSNTSVIAMTSENVTHITPDLEASGNDIIQLSPM